MSVGIISAFCPPIIMTEIFEIAAFYPAVDRRRYSMPIDQIMAEGGLFLGIEWPIFLQKAVADVATVIRNND
jgi:hypothetical protein